MPISKKFPIFLAASMLLTSLAASADVVVREVLLRKKGTDINVRVVVDNPAATTQRGPVVLTLYVRENSTSEWKKVKQWNAISKIKPGDKIARDIFSQNSLLLRNVATNYTWQARATATAPGAKSSELVVTNTGDMK